VISIDDFLVFVDEAIDAMVAIVEELGDDLANQRLDVDGSNSPYVVLTHCLGVMEYWAGHVVAGRSIERDRDAEFVASGPVAPLVERARSAQARLHDDAAVADPRATPRGYVRPEDAVLPLGRTQGGALLHVYEELAQHLGQMQVTRDVLLAR
jgi:hypothetical protein